MTAPAAATSALVVGIGSTLRGDDGVGQAVVEELARGPLPPGVELKGGDLTGFALLALLAGRELVVVVDAARMGLPPGSVGCFSPDRVAAGACEDPVSTHAAGLPDTVAMARGLGIAPPRFFVVGVEPEDVSVRDGLSPVVAAAVPAAARLVLRLLAGGEG